MPMISDTAGISSIQGGEDVKAAGFYTTPAGRNDLNYIGNVPLAAFEGPPLEVLKAAGLA